MSLLIVRDKDGQSVLTRELDAAEADAYYKAWMDAEQITLGQGLYRVHSVARTRPERNLVLCVSCVGTVPSIDC